jgi:hypothetical protein
MGDVFETPPWVPRADLSRVSLGALPLASFLKSTEKVLNDAIIDADP